MKTNSETSGINRIEKRAIEASVVVPIIQAVAQRIGKEEALAILQEVNEKEAFQRGESIRNKLGNTGIPELVSVHPETRFFLLNRGALKILPQAYS